MAKLKDIIGEELYELLSADKQKQYENKDYEDISGGAYVPKKRFDEVNETAKEYRKQVGEMEKQISDLKDQYKDVNGIKEKVTELENANKTQKETYEKQLAEIEFNNALEKSLGIYNIKDKKLVMALIDKNKLKVDGDNIIGFKEQIEPLQKSHEYLFEKKPNGTGSFNTGGGDLKPGEIKNFAAELGKRRVESMKVKNLEDFAK